MHLSPETITTFLSGYLHSLREETRDEKSGVKYGFDHIILKLAEADDLVPLRLAFHRGGRAGAPKPKKEHEYGEDLKVINRDGTKLTTFVLKAEELTYKKFTDANFDKDIRLAVTPDLSPPELCAVDEVKIIIVYNKDDEARGIEAYDRLIKALGKTINSSVKLTFERWNLTTLTEKVREKLIGSPALLPEQFFRTFSYLCWQVEDFSHGSEQWREVLIPDWKEFLAGILNSNAGEKGARLISVALIILHAHGKKEPSWETGWIEIIEWAMLALWRASRKSKSKGMHKEVHSIWATFYLIELQAYYSRNSLLLTTEDSLACGHYGELTEAVSTHHTYWHLGRLGILGCSFLQMKGAIPTDDKVAHEGLIAVCEEITSTLVGLMNANPASRRPLLDIHHIELFLVWLVMTIAGAKSSALLLFADIHERLYLRRRRKGGIPLIFQGNSWPELLEHIGSGDKPDESFGQSSYLLQMIIEICVCKLGSQGEAVAWAFYQHLILGCSDEGQSFDFAERVELQSWVPPADWLDKVLEAPIGDQGICIPVSYGRLKEPTKSEFPSKVREFVQIMREAHPPEPLEGIPFGAMVLACVLHQSPLPPEFWRAVGDSALSTKPEPIKRKGTTRRRKT